MFKFRKFNFDPKALTGANFRLLSEVVKLAFENKNCLFDDFSILSYNNFVEKMLTLINSSNPYFWVILRKSDEALVGFIYLYDIIWDLRLGVQKPHSACVTTCFKKEFWGQTVRLCAKKFFKYAFKNLKLEKIKAECFSKTPYIATLLTNLGFKLEGILKNETINGGKTVDIKLFALNKSSKSASHNNLH